MLVLSTELQSASTVKREREREREKEKERDRGHLFIFCTCYVTYLEHMLVDRPTL